MNKKIKIWAIVTVVALASCTVCYYRLTSKTAEQYTEQYIKEWLKFLNKKDEAAFNLSKLDPEPQELVNQYGTFLVKVKEVRSCLDGYKITFSVANPSDITFPNPKVKLKWNYPRKEYSPQDILDMPKEYHSEWYQKYQQESDKWSSSFKVKEFGNLKALEKKKLD